MVERDTADAQLQRLLTLLPRAARSAGVPLTELAHEMKVSQERLLADLQEIYTRAYYHPAGSGDDVQVLIDSNEVQVFTTGEFRRPPRLTPQESLALGLGIRMLAADATEARRPTLLKLAERVEEGAIGAEPTPLLDRIAVNPGDDSPEGIRGRLVEAARERRRCEIGYLKPGAAAPEQRSIDPYVLLAASGKWYLVAYCHRSEDIRVFRADRVVSVTTGEERFSVPEGFDPEAFVREGRVYHVPPGVEEADALVRYSSRIARWVEERGPVERQEDGSVLVRYRIADPGWLVRHVLEHGADAEVLEPAEIREAVAGVAARIARNG